MTYIVRETLVEISPTIIRKLNDLFEVDAPLYPYKGMGAPTKTTMPNLFLRPQGPKCNSRLIDFMLCSFNLDCCPTLC